MVRGAAGPGGNSMCLGVKTCELRPKTHWSVVDWLVGGQHGWRSRWPRRESHVLAGKGPQHCSCKQSETQIGRFFWEGYCTIAMYRSASHPFQGILLILRKE
jgi:hypothetical protein